MVEKVNEKPVINQKDSKDTERILIASLGALPYQRTTYVYGDERIEKNTNYAFHAVCEIEHPDKLLLVGTVDSFWHEMVGFFISCDEDRFSKAEKEIVQDFVKRSVKPKPDAEALLSRKDYSPLLELDEISREIAINCIIAADHRVFYEDGTQKGPDYGIVEEFLKKALHLDQVKIVIVPVGVDNDQQEKYFDLLREGINDLIEKSGQRHTEVLFDVTYGFRSMPLYIMMLIRYFDLLKSHNFVFKAYYGVFEARDKKNNTTPLMDLTIVPIMTDWINAIHDFIEFGSVKTLIKCLESEKKGKQDDFVAYIDEVTKEFGTFEYAMNANNLYYLVRGIVFITGLKYLSVENEVYRVLDVNHPAFSPQARMMLETILENYQKRFSTESMEKAEWCTTESYVLAQIARLYTSQGNYGDAAIAFQESVLTYVMERFLRDNIMVTECLGTPEEFYAYVHEFSNREKKKQGYIDHLNTSPYKENPTVFDELYTNIKDNIRNTLAHFKYEKTANVTIYQMEAWLTKGIAMLLEEMESGYGTEFANRTGLKDIYPTKSEDDIINETKKKLFNMILKEVGKNTYDLADNIEETMEDTEMGKMLSILNLSGEAVLRWVGELLSCCRDGGPLSSLAEETYGCWANKKISRARSKSKDPNNFDSSGIDTSLRAYLTSLHQVSGNRDRVIEKLRKDLGYMNKPVLFTTHNSCGSLFSMNHYTYALCV